MNKEKSKFSELGEDWDLRLSIKESLNRLNEEISIDDSQKYKIIQLLNEMFSLFEVVYSKNVGLINICQTMNDEVVHTASQITKNLSDLDESQRELKELNNDYQNILSVASERRDSLIDSKTTVQQFKEQIVDLKKNLNSKRATPESNRKLITDLHNEIKSLKLECQRNQKETKRINIEITENSDNLNNLNKIIQSFNAETENAITLINDYDKEKIELHKMNEETKKEIDEVESENIKIEEIQREENEKLELQREKLNTDAFSKLLTDFNQQILILQEERDDKLQTISKMSKQLKKIKSENLNKEQNRLKILNEIQKRDEQLEPIHQTVDSLKKEREAFFLQYGDMVKKFKTTQNDKNELRIKYKKLQEERFLLNCEFSRNESDRLLKIQKIQQETYDNQMQISYVQRESKKTEEISRQAADTNNDMTNVKRGIFDDRRYAKTINDEIEDKLVQRKFYLSNYLVEKSILDNNNQKIELLNEQIIESRKKGEQQIQMMQAAKHEKETFAKQMETVQKEYDQLSTQFQEITNKVDFLTNRIETLVNQTIKEHFLKSEYNAAISYINKMKKRTEKGIKITKKVIFNLISEQQTLKKIMDQTTLDQLSQKKQLQILKTSQDRIVNQISQKVKETNEKKNEFLSLDQLLKKGHQDYSNILKKIDSLNREFDHYMKKSALLQSKIDHLKELKENKKILENNLMIAKCQSMALFQESKIKINLHRWNELSALDNERMMQIKFHQRLKSKLIEKSEELKKLNDEKNELIEKVKERQKYVERFFKKKVTDLEDEYDDDDDGVNFDVDDFFITKQNKTKSDILLEEIEKAKFELREKSRQILEMREKIELKSQMVIENRESVKGLKKLVNDRKSIEFQLKSDINEFKSKLRNKITTFSEEKNESDEKFLQQIEENKMKAIITVRGGGFKPKPPNNNNQQINAPRSSRRRVRRKESPESPQRWHNEETDESDSLMRKQRKFNGNNGRKPSKNTEEIDLDDQNENDYVVRKRNGRIMKWKKQTDNNNEDKRYNYDALKENVNYHIYFDNNVDADQNSVLRSPSNAQTSRRPNVRELRKKLSRNVAVPETPNSRKQEKKKKKPFKKKKTS